MHNDYDLEVVAEGQCYNAAFVAAFVAMKAVITSTDINVGGEDGAQPLQPPSHVRTPAESSQGPGQSMRWRDGQEMIENEKPVVRYYLRGSTFFCPPDCYRRGLPLVFSSSFLLSSFLVACSQAQIQ